MDRCVGLSSKYDVLTCRETWDGLLTDLGATAANFAIAGDRVLHLLWRMQVRYQSPLARRATYSVYPLKQNGLKFVDGL